MIKNVNTHEGIRLGLLTRSRHIENYRQTLHDLGRVGIKVACYNLMSVFDWARSDLTKVLPDDSNVLSYDQSVIDKTIDPQKMANEIQRDFSEFEIPDWEPERVASLKRLLEQYKNVSHEGLFANLKYFLGQVISVREECDIRMAIHPDDLSWDIFGPPRIAIDAENLEKILDLVDSKHNGLTLCSDSFGLDSDNNVPAVIRRFGNRIHFAHMRNIKIHERGEFDESSHLSSSGSLNLFEIMKTYYGIGLEGYVRPDYGRMVWDGKDRASYGLYDRTLGIIYLNDLWEATDKMSIK